MNFSKWIRQIHRWLAIVFTAAVIINVIAVMTKKYSAGIGFLAVAPIFLLMFTGLYMFVVPYVTKLRNSN